MRILFWNTHRNNEINQVLAELIIENDISIVVLAEYTANSDGLFSILARRGIKMYEAITIGCNRIKVFGTPKSISPGRQTDYASIQIINNDIILCSLHLTSQIFSSSEGARNIAIQRIVADIQSTERELQNDKTIIVGDFNINPYDTGCLSAQYFHGIPIYSEAQRKSRTIAGEKFYMFYNPMWNLLGDFNSPFGTYYYSGNDVENTYWNMYDQVIIRPSLRERFVNDSLKILTETQTRFLLNSKGHPDNNISDHLPIVFEIKEEQG